VAGIGVVRLRWKYVHIGLLNVHWCITCGFSFLFLFLDSNICVAPSSSVPIIGSSTDAVTFGSVGFGRLDEFLDVARAVDARGVVMGAIGRYEEVKLGSSSLED